MAEITDAPPPALEAKPALLPGLASYLEAFNMLCGARAVGLAGPLPIALSEIESYCRLAGWHEPEEVMELVAIVQAMDADYLEVTVRWREPEGAVCRPADEAASPARAWLGPGERPDGRRSGRRYQK